ISRPDRFLYARSTSLGMGAKLDCPEFIQQKGGENSKAVRAVNPNRAKNTRIVASPEANGARQRGFLPSPRGGRGAGVRGAAPPAHTLVGLSAPSHHSGVTSHRSLPLPLRGPSGQEMQATPALAISSCAFLLPISQAAKSPRSG